MAAGSGKCRIQGMMPETKICHTDSNKTMKMKETYGAKHDKVDTIGKWQDATHYVFKKKKKYTLAKKGNRNLFEIQAYRKSNGDFYYAMEQVENAKVSVDETFERTETCVITNQKDEVSIH